MEIKKSELGIEFYNELAKLIKIRKDKRQIYLDTYLSDTSDFLLSQIQNKLKRVQLHFENKTQINNIEKVEDNLLDLAIYAIFLSIVFQRNDKNNNKKNKNNKNDK